MGGDHKCPVCQATFTRPQHVARHMRSHTGDRPYKCIHCGDQFARSDLLSRHVNKCHANEKGSVPPGAAGRRKGTTAATRATTSKQACDQCVQSSLPCDGSNPCSKCVARKTRCTFVKFHRQTAPVGPGHPNSLSATSLPGAVSGAAGSLPGAALLTGTHHSHSALSHPSHHPHLTLDHHQPQFLYAQQAASGGGYTFPSVAASTGSPTFAHGPHAGRGVYDDTGAYPPPPGSAPSTTTTTGTTGTTTAGASYYSDYPPPPDSFRGAADAYDYEGSSEHSGSAAGSRPASSAGLSDYAPYSHHTHPHIPNGRHSLDLHDLHSHDPHGHGHTRPPEFSASFGLMSLDDPQVLAGLATDGVPFFSSSRPGTASSSSGVGAGHTGLTPLEGLKRMPLVPAQTLAYQPYPSGGGGGTPGPGNAQTPGTREAETRELREFWKAYMRTPLTGPGGESGSGGLGMQTPSASAAAAASATGGLLAGGGPAGGNGNGGNGTRRYRVASLPSVRTPEGEMDAAPTWHHQPQPGAQGQQQQQHQGPAQARTMHNADDLRSYEAAVLARKAPELVLRKPRRPTTSAGPAGAAPSQLAPHHSPPPQHQQPGPPAPGSASQSSSLAGAFGFTGGTYAASSSSSGPAASSSTGSVPNSPFPGTPTSTTASTSDDGADDDGGSSRPSFKRLPSQTLGPAQAKRRRDRPAELALAAPSAGAAGSEAVAPIPEVNAYPDRPMIALRAPPPPGNHHHHPQQQQQRRARRLSAPASPTSPGFVV